jgi:hypothetical protein
LLSCLVRKETKVGSAMILKNHLIAFALRSMKLEETYEVGIEPPFILRRRSKKKESKSTIRVVII